MLMVAISADGNGVDVEPAHRLKHRDEREPGLDRARAEQRRIASQPAERDPLTEIEQDDRGREVERTIATSGPAAARDSAVAARNRRHRTAPGGEIAEQARQVQPAGRYFAERRCQQRESGDRKGRRKDRGPVGQEAEVHVVVALSGAARTGPRTRKAQRVARSERVGGRPCGDGSNANLAGGCAGRNTGYRVWANAEELAKSPAHMRR